MPRRRSVLSEDRKTMPALRVRLMHSYVSAALFSERKRVRRQYLPAADMPLTRILHFLRYCDLLHLVVLRKDQFYGIEVYLCCLPIRIIQIAQHAAHINNDSCREQFFFVDIEYDRDIQFFYCLLAWKIDQAEGTDHIPPEVPSGLPLSHPRTSDNILCLPQ